jgi:nitroreductase / dihydropteridine reductase
MGLIENLKWRYATKKFDTSKKVSAGDLAKLQEAIQLTPSAFGFQPFEVLIVENPALRTQLREASYKQSQIEEASYLFVFCAKTKTDATDVDDLMELVASTRGLKTADLQGYSDYVKGAIGWMTAEQQLAWNSKQVYIALGNLLAMCAELKLDACPMEGFLSAEYDRILDLPTKGLAAVVVATIGYRSVEDATANFKKVRKPIAQLFRTI